MDDLGGALRELAGRATAPSAGDPAELWRQGRARVRRRRVTAALALAGVVVAGYAVVVRPEPEVVMPAGEVHAPALPRNIYAPNRFAAGVSDAGPPGQLAVIAEKRSTADEEDQDNSFWFGVSATDGRYSKLDLPDIAGGSPMRLSPNGTKIAYAITGATRKTAFEVDNDPDPSAFPKDPGAGVAVYDTESGSVTRYQILTDYGIATGDDLKLTWLSESRLVFGYYRTMSPNSIYPAGSFRWDLPAGMPISLDQKAPEAADLVPGWMDSEFVSMGSEQRVIVDRDGDPTGRRVGNIGSGIGPYDVSVSGDRVVSTTTIGKNGGIRQVLTGVQTDPRKSPRVKVVGDLVLPFFLGWVSERSVLIAAEESEAYSAAESADGIPGRGCAGPCGDARNLYVVDLVAETTKKLGRVDADVDPDSLEVARDLLRSPMVHGRRPPSLVDAYRTWIIGGGVLVVALAAWWYFRPKRRAWRAYLARERGDDA